MVQAIKTDYRKGSLSPRLRAILDYAAQIATKVHRVSRQTIEGLQQAGLSDEEILDTAEIAALFCYYTRLVDALGIEPEDFMKNPASVEA